MFVLLFTAPLMLIAIAAAVVPVLITMIRDERSRQAARLAATGAVHLAATGAETDDEHLDRELVAA